MIDVTPIINVDNDFQNITQEIKSNFICEWEDAVHNSFEIYVKQMLMDYDKIHGIRTRIEVLQKEIENLKLDDTKNKIDELIKRVEKI